MKELFESTLKLFETNPFQFSEENKKLFLASFREIAETHYNHHPYIKAIWDEQKKHPSQIATEEDLESAPFMMVSVMKERPWKSVPDAEIVLSLTSSGTGGQKSYQFLNQFSLNMVKLSALRLHEALGMVDELTYNYLCFTYDPVIANDLGTAFTDELLTSFTKKKEVYYAFQWDEGKKDFVFNKQQTWETLKRFSHSGFSTRILGFPAFLNQLLDDYTETLHLGEKSWVQTGGGWKGLADQEIPKQDFRKKVSQRLGLPETHIRDMFGMVEHGIAYLDCEWGNLHIPNYSRVYIRDPKTLSVLEEGQTGLIQFICTYNTSYPAFNILSTDYGCLKKCPCGKGQVLVLKGRAGVTKHKGCAIKALEMMEGNP